MTPHHNSTLYIEMLNGLKVKYMHFYTVGKYNAEVHFLKNYIKDAFLPKRSTSCLHWSECQNPASTCPTGNCHMMRLATPTAQVCSLVRCPYQLVPFPKDGTSELRTWESFIAILQLQKTKLGSLSFSVSSIFVIYKAFPLIGHTQTNLIIGNKSDSER